jgi:hypothetical protein
MVVTNQTFKVLACEMKCKNRSLTHTYYSIHEILSEVNNYKFSVCIEICTNVI